MVINLNPATASDYNASGNGSGDGVGVGVSVGVNPGINGGVAVTPSANVIGGTGNGSGSGNGSEGGGGSDGSSGSGSAGGTGTGTVNLNGNGNGAENSGVGNGSGNVNGNGNGNGGSGTNIMGIITHAIFNGIIYLHVIYAGEDSSKWITLDEAMAFCPSGVVAYTTLQISEVYDVPMEMLFD